MSTGHSDSALRWQTGNPETKTVFHTPREVHPLVDTLAQGMLFESPAKFERMQAFLDRKKK
jgi:enoyl-CoA hydratase